MRSNSRVFVGSIVTGIAALVVAACSSNETAVGQAADPTGGQSSSSATASSSDGTTGGASTGASQGGTTRGDGATGAGTADIGATGGGGTTGIATSASSSTAGSGGITGTGNTTATAGSSATSASTGASAGTTGNASATSDATTGTVGTTTAGTTGATTVSFMTRTLSTLHFAEGADVGDIDGDGSIDLVAGPNWYKGPGFALGGTLFANPPSFTADQYSTFFLTFVDDLNGDGHPDVIAIGDAGGANGTGTPNAFWYTNPGPANLAQPWTKQAIYGGLVANESPAYVNLVGDAKKELVFMTNKQLGYATPGATPTAPWTFNVIGGNFGTPYVHGLGVGDVDGDGLKDVVERSGWWRQVAGAAGALPTWEQHTVDFGAGADKSYSNWGGSEMYVYDIDGDGDNDVVTVLAAHQYGLSWFEQQKSGTTISFVAHVILPAMKTTTSFSQQHSMAMADVNGDKLPDIITGKRYYAHPSTDPDPGTTDPPVIYWFELQRSGGTATFIPHLIHDASGSGCNFTARDLTGDGKVDVFTTNKKGTFLHVQM